MFLWLLLPFVPTFAQQLFNPYENTLQCGFSCTRRAQFISDIDGVRTTAKCTDNNADPRIRCDGCCKSVALAAGLPTENAGSFPSTNGKDCVCCINNDRCATPSTDPFGSPNSV